MYVKHYDHPNQQWNIFFEDDGRQMYLCSFSTVEEADRFCRAMNGG